MRQEVHETGRWAHINVKLHFDLSVCVWRRGLRCSENVPLNKRQPSFYMGKSTRNYVIRPLNVMKMPEHSRTSGAPHCIVLLPKSLFVMMDWDTQHRSVVHNVVLYCLGGAQRSTHKLTHTDRKKGLILLPRSLMREVKIKGATWHWPVGVQMRQSVDLRHTFCSRSVYQSRIRYGRPSFIFCMVDHPLFI